MGISSAAGSILRIAKNLAAELDRQPLMVVKGRSGVLIATLKLRDIGVMNQLLSESRGVDFGQRGGLRSVYDKSSS